eukprot:13211-Chlamydomonas_euryale.AAC.1
MEEGARQAGPVKEQGEWKGRTGQGACRRKGAQQTEPGKGPGGRGAAGRAGQGTGRGEGARQAGPDRKNADRARTPIPNTRRASPHCVALKACHVWSTQHDARVVRTLHQTWGPHTPASTSLRRFSSARIGGAHCGAGNGDRRAGTGLARRKVRRCRAGTRPQSWSGSRGAGSGSALQGKDRAAELVGEKWSK